MLGFKEAPISFPPTYKHRIGESIYNLSRTPSWTDRILYKPESVIVSNYTSILEPTISDHRPVVGEFIINIKK